MSFAPVDRNQPSFCLFQINNNRTAWRPVGLPIILVVPHSKSFDGTKLEYSEILSTRVYIENVAKNAYVVGQDHILQDGTQQRYPSKELYSVQIYRSELINDTINPKNHQFYDINGNKIEYYDQNGEQIRSYTKGDYFDYTTGTGISGSMPYYPDADYIDLSGVNIDVEILPNGYYNLVYEATYYARTVTTYGNEDFLCVNSGLTATTTFRFGFDHPGQVMHEMYRLTPPPYLENTSKAQDSTVAFYRPYSDILNDIYDEQALLKSINWVNKAPLEIVPYLAFLLGWELPYFPQTSGAKTLDAIRRAVIKNTVYFQNIKGSKKAIKEIFEIFGLDILVENLWWSKDGKILIRPNQDLNDDYISQKISAIETPQIDVILKDYTADKSSDKIVDVPTNNLIGTFVDISTNLLFLPRTLGTVNYDKAILDSYDITLEAITVDSTAADGQELIDKLNIELQKAVENPAGYGNEANVIVDPYSGIQYPKTIDNMLMKGNGGLPYKVLGRSQIRFNGITGLVVNQHHFGSKPALNSSAFFDPRNNKVSFSYDGLLEPNHHLFVFATYKRIEFDVPSELEGLQSNRFDIQILNRKLQSEVDPKTLNFSLDFLYKLKAFHSLLHTVRLSILLTETYEVTDLKIGGDSPQRYDNTDLGRLQVPPAIIPNPKHLTCGTPESLGFKQADLDLRFKKLINLTEEHAVSYSLEKTILNQPAGDLNPPRSDVPFGGRISPLPRIERNSIANGKSGAYSAYGQDIIKPDSRVESLQTVFHPDPNSNSNSFGSRNPDNKSASYTITNSRPEYKSTNNNSGGFGSFTKETRAVAQSVQYPLDGYNDYVYKGRVNDSILYRQNNKNEENIFFNTSQDSLFLGSGVYYAYPRLTKMIVPNLKFSGNSPNGGVEYYNSGFMADVFKNRDQSIFYKRITNLQTKNEETIHFLDNKNKINSDQKANQAIQRQSLGIAKSDLQFPGCRFPKISNLTNDFASETHNARPWDDAYSSYCGEQIGSCGNRPTFLNFYMEINTDGDEYLQFDEVQYINIGNGLEMDIIDLGANQHSGTAISTHSINSAGTTSPYVIFDGIDVYGESVNVTNVDNRIFKSAIESGVNMLDILDGHASELGVFTYSLDFVDVYNEVLAALGRPYDASAKQLLFKLSSGVLSDNINGFRLDSGSLISRDDFTYSVSAYSMLNSYRDDTGLLDLSPDRVYTDTKMVLAESVGSVVLTLDGTLGDLASLI